MGDVAIRIGEGIATVLAYLGASALVIAAISILFPVAAIVVGLCLCGPLSTPVAALMASCSFANASQDRIRRAESQWKKVRKNFEKASNNLEYADSGLSLARLRIDESEPVSTESLGKFQLWGRLKRSKQRFDASMLRIEFDQARERKKRAEQEMEKIRNELLQAERERLTAVRSRKRRLIFHSAFTIAIFVVVLWVLYLLPPP